MADERKQIKAKKIIDVAHPGQSAPSPNSKSVIISHHPMLQDPMVNAEKSSETTVIEEVKATRAARPVLQPGADLSPAEKSDDEAKADAPQVADDAEPASKAEVDSEEAKSKQPGTGKAVPTDQDTVIIEDDADTKRRTEIQEIIDEKKYYLPIVTVETKRTKQFVIGGIILSIVLALAWADIALDAGLIHIGGLKSLTHFFSS
jgi:hypothetical protein